MDLIADLAETLIPDPILESGSDVRGWFSTSCASCGHQPWPTQDVSHHTEPDGTYVCGACRYPDEYAAEDGVHPDGTPISEHFL